MGDPTQPPEGAAEAGGEAKVEAAKDNGGEAKGAEDVGGEAKVEAVKGTGSEAGKGAGDEAKATEEAARDGDEGEAAKGAGSEAGGAEAAGGEADGEAAVKEPPAAQAAGGEAEAEEKAEPAAAGGPRGRQVRGDTSGVARLGTGDRGTGRGATSRCHPACARQEPTWLQDEEDELWPEFPPCSPSTEGAASPTSPLSPTSPVSPTSPLSPVSPTSPTGGTPSGAPVPTHGGHTCVPRAVSPGGPRDRVPPRVVAVGRPRASAKAQGRSAILEKFGGAAKGPAPHLKRSGGAGSVKAMLLEWCRARTRGYQHVDIQNFTGSWGSGLAFCALIHSFFPDAFDYGSLQPQDRRHNFTLAFATAEARADCAPLLDVEDMLRLAVPDAKCIYTYVQELYRSLVAKGLVKTKKR
ncbi:Smoothelin-like protein 1 isoform X1 [Aix galericulata]|nr:Smoothelin-like protein 1 isoform X1 [Aix galericulata]